MTFRVGQEVVCVEDRAGLFKYAANHFYNHNMHSLKKGTVYTVRGFYAGPGIIYTPGSIYLNEITRPISSEGVECPFHPARFRPVVKTDISIFQAMLAPSPKKRVDA